MARLFSILLTFLACLWLWVAPATAQRVAPEVIDGLEAQVLNLSFDDLPAFEQGGIVLGYRDSVFQIEGRDGLDRFDTAAETAGFPIPIYDPAREWLAGQFPSDVIKLGDLLYTGMGIEQLTMDSIAQITGIDIENFQLADVPFLSDVTLSDLVGTVPFLGDYKLTDLPELAQSIGALNTEETLSQLLFTNSALGQTPVVGDALGTLQVADLPNLGNTHLGDLPKIGDDVVANIPGLSVMKLGSFPGLALSGGLIPLAKQDIAFDHSEYSGDTATPNPVSGGTNGGKEWKAIPCQEGCAHIELYDSDVSPVKGAWTGSNWMTRQHRVKDGYGLLGSLFSEAGAYRLPFGDTFALQVRSTDEKTGAADWGLAFRVCSKGLFFDLGCTAYFLEVDLPITTYEGATILTGIKDGKGGVTEPVAAPEGWEALRPATPPNLQGLLGANANQPLSGGLCGKGPGGVNYEALAKAFASIEGNYHSVGDFTDGGKGGKGGNGERLRGRGLGRYQYMTYREDVRQAIRAQPGGHEFLEKADREDVDISPADVEKFFPPDSQDRLFKADQKSLIERAINEGAQGDRIIERVGQMHYTGPRGIVDGQGADIHRRLTIKEYGKAFSEAYFQALEGSDSQCGKATGKFINPNPNGLFTSGFGQRYHPKTGQYKFHGGIDLASPTGTPGASILATDGGTVIAAGWYGGYGNYVEIDHGSGTKSWYGHLSGISVRQGDAVKQGDPIGQEGTTGLSTGVHLHFGLEVNGQLVDPAAYIPI